MASLGITAKIGTAEQFRGMFSPDQANSVSITGQPLLADALSNTKPEERYEIASLLLDYGARADFHSGSEGEPALRILLGANTHDPVKTTQLMLRLIDAGADVNARSYRGDSILNSLLILPYGDDDWIPIYDIVFSRPLTVLEAPNRVGLMPLQLAEKTIDLKPELFRRIKEAVEHEIDVIIVALLSIEEENRRLGRHTLLRALQPGVPASYVRSQLSEVGLRSTPELEALYGWHNGISASETATIGEISLWPGFYFPPIESAVSNYRAFVPDSRWKAGWLPVFSDGGGDFYVVDLSDPDESPVRDFRIQYGECIIEFDSLGDMFSTLEQAFKREVFFLESATQEYLEMDDLAFDALAAELNPGVEWWQRE